MPFESVTLGVVEPFGYSVTVPFDEFAT